MIFTSEGFFEEAIESWPDWICGFFFTYSATISASDPTKREYYWMRTLKTLYPDGLNLESDY